MFAVIAGVLYFIGGVAYGYNVHLPPNNGEDDYKAPPAGGARVDGEESELYMFIDFINEHLRFALAVIAFVAVLYSGVKFAMSGGQNFDPAKNLLTGLGAGLFLAVFSYAIIRIVTNLI